MIVHTDGLVAAVGQYGPFKDSGNVIPYVDWLDSNGGVYRATLPAGMEAPQALQQGHATLDLIQRDNGQLRLRVVELKLAEARRAA